MARTAEKRGRKGCCLGCAGAVVGPVLLLAGILCWNNRPPNDVVIPPPPPLPAGNGYEDVARACDMLKGQQHLFPASVMNYNPATYTLRDYAAAYREAAPAFAALRPALRKPYQRPADRTGSHWAAGHKEARHMARSLSGAAEYMARLGRYREAADLLLDCEELGVIVPHGGATTDDLAGSAIEMIGLYHVEALLPKLAAPDLAHFAERLEGIAARRTPYADVVRETGNNSATLWKETLGQFSPMAPSAYYVSLRDMTTDPVAMFTGTAPRYPTAAQAGAMARLALTSKHALLRERLAFYQAAARDVAGAYTGRLRSATATNATLVGDTRLVEDVWWYHVAHQAAVDVLRVEVGLLRYRKDHGHYPDRLDALAPKYLRAVPDDVCAGKPGVPLRYTLKPGGGYLLYGVGPDMRDDGGATVRVYVPAEPGDIVAGHLNGR